MAGHQLSMAKVNRNAALKKLKLQEPNCAQTRKIETAGTEKKN